MSILSFLAATPMINPADVGLTNPVKSGEAALSTILTTTYTWAGIICVLIIVIAGYFYVTSGGNPSTTKRAREAIIGAVVGVIIVIMAFVITQFILGRF
jgi:Ni,Fe-hydrogenase I cytochrome b subunit